MKLLSLICLAIVFIAITPFLSAQTGDPGAGAYALLYKSLTSLQPDSTSVATVSNLKISRDAATFDLVSGKLLLCKSVVGRTCAALFIGDGSYRFTPSTAVERAHLARFFKTESMNEPIAMLFLVFADTTLEELRRTLTFAPGVVPPGVEKELEKYGRFISNADSKSLDEAFARAFLNDEKNDLFYAHMITGSGEHRFFQVNPYDVEEVSFMRRGQAVDRVFRELVSMAHYQSEYASEPRAEDKRSVAVDRYVVECDLADNLNARFRTDLTFRPLKADLRWIDFSLYPELRVDSIIWDDGTPAAFHQVAYHRMGDNTLWVRNVPASGGARTLKIFYGGNLLFRERDWVLLKSSIGWYPTHDAKNKALFDLTFRTPKSMKFASVGRLLSSETRGDQRITRWVGDTPIRNASFNIGVFQEQNFTPDSVAPITVYRGPESSGGMGEQIGWDVENSIKFYEHLYGKLPFEHFYVTEIPAYHGEAFPGLIHLSFSTFLRNNNTGYAEIFRAHEVAHQWWGIGVDFASYHDQWISEGFSEYSGLMYMQAVLKDNEKFFRRMNDYKKELLGNRKSIFLDGQQAGPIWLGWRTSSSSTQGDYDLIIYKKGAWVLHMLRNYFLDLNTMKEDTYRSMMREFFTSSVGRSVSTEDFQRVVEKYAGANMGWFFNQWVYGTGIPSYTYAYKVEEAPGGKYKVMLRVKQANVPPDFQMVVPVKIDFGDGKAARVRVLVRGAESEQQLPLMPLEPKKVIFNDLESVLCEVDTERW